MGSVTTMVTKEVLKLTSFFVMGDGGVYKKDSNKYHYFAMNMKAENDDYIYWVRDVLSNITYVRCTNRTLQNDGYNRNPQLALSTRVHPIFTKLRKRIYVDNYKGVSSHYLKLLDPQCLAILYMCDGSLYIDKPTKDNRLINDSYNVTLNLKRLSEGDTLLLKSFIKKRLDLEFNIQRQYNYYYLRLRCKDVPSFMNMVSPFILTSFHYKVLPSYRTIDSVNR